jgi:hypothetical protein
VEDILYLAVALVFFAVAAGYVWLCDRIGEDPGGGRER